MASQPSIVAHIVEQLAGAGHVTARKMFGEYAISCDGKPVALVCDDRLLVKPTPGGRAQAEDLAEASPYPGAKPCLLVPEERWDDRDWLVALVRITAAELPEPAPKRAGKGRRGSSAKPPPS